MEDLSRSDTKNGNVYTVIQIDPFSAKLLFSAGQYHAFVYFIGFFYLVVLIGENYQNNLCYFLRESHFGIRNITLSVLIFVFTLVSPYLDHLLSFLLKEDIVIEMFKIGAVLLEFFYVVAVGYYYIFILTAFAIGYLVIVSVLGVFLEALFTGVGALVSLGLVSFWYFPSVLDFGLKLLVFPKNYIICFGSNKI